MKKLKVLSLFSGIGAPEKAFKNIEVDINLFAYCEVDKYASQSYSKIHDVSEELNLGDITKIKLSELPDDIDFISHGSPCFTGDTLVLTQKGYKQIKDIQIGDKVLDHTNNYRLVSDFLEQGEKEIWKIKAMAFHELNTTSNHKFLARKKERKWNSDKKAYERLFEKPQWIECKNLSKDYYLGISINKESKLPNWKGVEYLIGQNKHIKKELDMNDELLWYLCGRYLGDGWTRTRKDRNNNLDVVVICCGKHKAKEFESKIKGRFNYTKVEERTTFKYQFSNKELAHFLNQFGKGAKNKFIPGFVIDLPTDKLKQLIQGYIDSDGCYDSKNRKYKITSINQNLIYGISQCIAKVYKCPYSICKCERPSKCVVEGRTVNQNDTYDITFHTDKRKQDRAFYEAGYIWFPIKEVINTSRKEKVYDITVENSHSFTANSCIVHNCQDFSIAGSQAGGDKGSNTRSSLMWNTVDIVDQCKPKIVLWENVKNLLSKKHIHNFNAYLDTLEKLGYNNYYKVLNAKDYRIPQNRERVFTISIRKDIDTGKFEFPETQELKLRLKDLLENNVEEKYYVSKEKVEQLMKNLKGNVDLTKQVIGTCHKKNDLSFATRDRVYNPDRLSPTLSATQYKDPIKVLEAKRIGGIFDTEKSKHQAGSIWDKEMLSPTLDTMQGGWRQPCIIDDTYGFDNEVRAYDVFCPTLRSERTGLKVSELPLITPIDNGFRVRKLTPLECWRLMGFDDEDFYKAAQVCSNTQLYKQAGNSIVVTVLEEIFKMLIKAELLEGKINK